MSVQEILTLLGSGSAAITVLAVLLYAVVNDKLVFWFELFTRLKNRRTEYKQTFLRENDDASAKIRAVIRDVSEAREFQRATGIYAESRMRKCLLNLHQQISDDKIDWHTIRLAYPYLQVENSQLRVKSLDPLRKLALVTSWLITIGVIAALTICTLGALYLIYFNPFTEAWIIGVQFAVYAIALGLILQVYAFYPRTWLAARSIKAKLTPRGSETCR